MSDVSSKMNELRAAAKTLPIESSLNRLEEIAKMQTRYDELNELLNGNGTLRRLDIDGEYSTRQRAQNALGDVFGSLSNVTVTSRNNLEIASKEFAEILREARSFKLSMDQMISSYSGPELSGQLPKWTNN